MDGRFFRFRDAASLGAIVLLLSSCSGGSMATTSPTPAESVPYVASDLAVGTGRAAQKFSSVTVAYTGWLYDAAAPDAKGTQFDSSTDLLPFTFVLSTREVIEGWDLGVVGMRIGGRRRLQIPSRLAYGSSGQPAGGIPPNTALVFDIELLDVG
jgi:FKBP-type peptidyl-prolyl cis-trans isomerase FkpA